MREGREGGREGGRGGFGSREASARGTSRIKKIYTARNVFGEDMYVFGQLEGNLNILYSVTRGWGLLTWVQFNHRLYRLRNQDWKPAYAQYWHFLLRITGEGIKEERRRFSSPDFCAGRQTLHSTAEVPDNMTKASG